MAKRKLPIVECDICTHQQVDNGDPTEILGLTIRSGSYVGYAGGGPIPKDTFICLECLDGNDEHGPLIADALRLMVFLDERDDIRDYSIYAPKGDKV